MLKNRAHYSYHKWALIHLRRNGVCIHVYVYVFVWVNVCDVRKLLCTRICLHAYGPTDRPANRMNERKINNESNLWYGQYIILWTFIFFSDKPFWLIWIGVRLCLTKTVIVLCVHIMPSLFRLLTFIGYCSLVHLFVCFHKPIPYHFRHFHLFHSTTVAAAATATAPHKVKQSGKEFNSFLPT